MYERAAARENIPMMAKLLELAAREAANIFADNAKGEGEDLTPPKAHTFVSVVDAKCRRKV